ncbi:glycosyltransferase [Pedobacter aquae]|uniref:Glycosyltransferase n=1 Tax=Pedobacter aquae TaxID=2605747 RepID=A0A5C0VER5_9SPHI|nr:glycosyltransferase family 4 protein [Pedobacter aquae]QEK50333.1 glycosyltransferase [Pedobacter aquae]
MKILFLSHDSHLHGATRSMLDLAEEFSNKGHEAKVILPTGGLAENYLKNKHIPFKKVFYPLFIQYGKEDKLKTQFKKLYSAFRHLPILVSYIKEYNPDIIYINTSVNYWLLILSFFYKKPIILHLREFGKEDHAVFKNFKGLMFNLLKKRATLYLSNSRAIQQYYQEKYQIKSYLLYNGVFKRETFIQNSTLKKINLKVRQPLLVWLVI